ncbi:uncharacterized protein VP01_2104g4 [Puccinia sorghi]|uniref:Uncharacterized protein n=1 Tax=Puccinia sorghi TaxID=27349 RepID=A0A0L6VAC3_9BASI|nr:uncharacterized protein VP01_2104g4 [Puccinia sorghi]
MDLSPFKKAPRNQLSDAKQTRWVQQNIFISCGQAGHISCRCLKGGWEPQGRLQPLSSAWLSKLQAEINVPTPAPVAPLLRKRSCQNIALLRSEQCAFQHSWRTR